MIEQEEEIIEQEEELKVPSQQLFDNIFGLCITTVKQIAQEKSTDIQVAKEIVANYLERIVNGLRDTKE